MAVQTIIVNRLEKHCHMMLHRGWWVVFSPGVGLSDLNICREADEIGLVSEE